MSKKQNTQTVSWKDIQMVTTDDGREIYYFVSPNLEVFMDEDIAELETLIRNHYHLADVAQEYMPLQNSKKYVRYIDGKKSMQYGYQANADYHSMDCERETVEKISDDTLEWHEQQRAYAEAMEYLPTDGGGH